MNVRRICCVTGLLLLMCGPVAAENWPQWRGANFNGISGEQGLPTTWSKSENVKWRVPLPGPGMSTPVVWGDHIFLTSADGNDLALLCIGTDGKILWKQQVGTGNQSVRSDEGNYAAPSPATDGKYVWAFMSTGDLACYDFDGNLVWEKNLQTDYGKFKIAFGMTSSPVLYGDKLYVQCMYTGDSYVVAFDKLTGREIWKIHRESDARAECEHSYASPMIYADSEREYLLTHGADYVVAHSLEDGSEIWRCGGLNPKGNYNPTLRLVASPVCAPGLIVVPSAKNGPVFGLRPDMQGDLTDPKAGGHIWIRDQNTPDVPSPLILDGLVYLCRENGNLICLDAKTGEHYYEEKTERFKHRGSPVYADGKIYLTGRNGIVSVVKPGKAFELLAQNDLGEDIAASPAISNGVIYLRSYDALYAIK